MIQTTAVVTIIVGNRSTSGRPMSNTRLRRPFEGPAAKLLYANGTAMTSSSGGCAMAVNRDLLRTSSTARTQPTKYMTVKNIVSTSPRDESTA